MIPALETSTSTGPCVCLGHGERGVDGRAVGDVAAHSEYSSGTPDAAVRHGNPVALLRRTRARWPARYHGCRR